ncbi:hypothetical protein GCM10010317_092260 [Streptomyces mirabilis]|nr:hypothetical protein GCM10010317_092260 [Streptomyces mirabilis]
MQHPLGERVKLAQTGSDPLQLPHPVPRYRLHWLRNGASGLRGQALLCLARRRADVLFAMLRDGTFYAPQPAQAVAQQA